MNVLSLFDGMSCGRIALDRIGTKVNNYFASEVDNNAIKISKKNYPDIKQIGDVTKVSGKDLEKIDLLLGGSPCQGFSFAGNRLNFEDPRSKLFFEFVRLMKETKPKWFLLENVLMEEKHQNIITKHLGVCPVFIDSADFSACNRKRLYWTNIPFSTYDRKNLVMSDVLDQKRHLIDVTERYNAKKPGTLTFKKSRGNCIHFNQKHHCLLASAAPTSIGSNGGVSIKIGDNFYVVTPEGAEILQTVPPGYTEGVSNSARYKMLGNGWTVDVIAHILSNIGGSSPLDI